MMTSTGRHLDETRAGIPNATSERADLYGQSYCERHQGQLPKGRTRRPDIWAHRSRMRSAKEKRALDRGVVPHMGMVDPRLTLEVPAAPHDAAEWRPVGHAIKQICSCGTKGQRRSR